MTADRVSRRRALKAAAGIAALATPVTAFAATAPADPIVPLAAKWLAGVASERDVLVDHATNEQCDAFWGPLLDIEHYIRATPATTIAGVLAKMAMGLAIARVEAGGWPDQRDVDFNKMPLGVDVHEELFIAAAVDAERITGGVR